MPPFNLVQISYHFSLAPLSLALFLSLLLFPLSEYYFTIVILILRGV